MLRDQDGVRAARDAGVQGDPPRVTAHHLEHHAAFVRVAGGTQPVDGLRGDLDRGVETERVVGRGDVVVDGLRHADDVDAVFEQALRRGGRAVAADGDHTVDLEVLEDLLDVLRAAVRLGVRTESTGAEDGAALVAQTTHTRAVELDDVAVDQSVPAVTKTDELLPVDGFSLENRTADDRIQTRAVASGGENAVSLRHVSSCLPPSELSLSELAAWVNAYWVNAYWVNAVQSSWPSCRAPCDSECRTAGVHHFTPCS